MKISNILIDSDPRGRMTLCFFFFFSYSFFFFIYFFFFVLVFFLVICYLCQASK